MAGLFYVVRTYEFDPASAALVGFIVGLWTHEPFLKYGNHLIAAITGGSVDVE